jgi:hypothetical protein
LSRLAQIRHLVQRLRHRDAVEASLDEEVRGYFDEMVERGVERGLSREAAIRAARVMFGGPEQVKQQVREARMGATIERVLMDVRYGIRMLVKQPGYAVIAVLTLALGIGATTAIFTLIQGVLLSSSPYAKPDQLVLMPAMRADGRAAQERAWPSLQWMDWQKQAKSFQTIAGYSWSFGFLVRNDGSLSIEGMNVSPNYFDVMGLKPILGRAFLPSERTQASNQVAVIGYDLWQDAFHGDPKVIGTTMRMSRREITRFAPPSASAERHSSGKLLPKDWSSRLRAVYSARCSRGDWLQDSSWSADMRSRVSMRSPPAGLCSFGDSRPRSPRAFCRASSLLSELHDSIRPLCSRARDQTAARIPDIAISFAA